MGLSDSSSVPWFIMVVHPASLSSLGCALLDVGLICDHWGEHFMSSSSSGVPGLIWIRPRVHPRLLGSLRCALRVVGFIQCPWVHCSTPWGRCVH